MPDAIFEYAGIPLLFDYDRTAQRFLDRFLPVQNLVTPAGMAAHDDWQGNTYGQGRAGLPRPNYPPAPPPRVNTLYWPTGAVRWARGWFLGDQAAVDALTKFNDPESAWADGYAVARTLRASTPDLVDNSAPYVLEAEMYLLRPLRITATGDTTFGDLWLLPLVDQRYWWQFRRCGDLTASLDDWVTLVSALGTQLGVTITCSTVNSAYMVPDRIELARHEDNPAVVLDAVAHSIGRRVVVDYSGDVRLVNYTTEQTALAANWAETSAGATKYLKLQGGTPDDAAPPPAYPWPDELRIAFQKIEDPADSGAGTFWTTAKLAADIASEVGAEDLVTVEGTSKTVHCSAWAMFQCGGSTTDPANKDNLEDLRDQYALDYFGWLAHQYDHAWPGVQNWPPCGYDDHVLFEFGTEYTEDLEALADLDDGQRETVDVMIRERLARRYLTRVQSMPGNFGVSSLLCQYENAIPGVADDLMVKTPLYGISARRTATMPHACCNAYTEVNGVLVPVQCNDSGLLWKLRVRNVYCEPVPELLLVPSSVLKSGTRYVVNWWECEESSDSSDSSPSDSSESSLDSSDSSGSSDSDSPDSSGSSGSDILDSSDSVASDQSSEESAELPQGDCEHTANCYYTADPSSWYLCNPAYPPYVPGWISTGRLPCDSGGCYCPGPSRCPEFEGDILYMPCMKY